MADSDLPDPEPTISDAANKAHDKIDDFAPEDKKDQAHDAVDKGQDAAKHASYAAENLADAAMTKAAPALDQAKSTYGKNPRRWQIIGAVVGTVLLVVLFRRTRNN